MQQHRLAAAWLRCGLLLLPCLLFPHFICAEIWRHLFSACRASASPNAPIPKLLCHTYHCAVIPSPLRCQAREQRATCGCRRQAGRRRRCSGRCHTAAHSGCHVHAGASGMVAGAGASSRHPPPLCCIHAVSLLAVQPGLAAGSPLAHVCGSGGTGGGTRGTRGGLHNGLARCPCPIASEGACRARNECASPLRRPVSGPRPSATLAAGHTKSH